MATMNPFDLLGDDDNEDPSLLAAAQKKLDKPKKESAPVAAKPAKLPSKPLPPSEAVREAKTEPGRGGGRGFGRGRGRFNRDSGNNEAGFNNNGISGGYRNFEGEDGGRRPSERRGGYGGPRGSFGGRRGPEDGETERPRRTSERRGADDGETERPRRIYDRRSGTGRDNGFKRDGAGQGNWGTPSDDIAPRVAEETGKEIEKNANPEKQAEDETVEDKENPVNEPEVKEPEEDKEMTLEEYEKVLEEKRKALIALKTEERKVNIDKDLKSMQQLSSKKTNDEIFAKLGSDKDKRKDAADKEEKAKKSLSINEFLKPVNGERNYTPGGRGRGRGRGSRGGYGGGYTASNVAAPKIEDPTAFPTLGGK